MKVLLLLTGQLLAQNSIEGRISKAEEKCAVFLDKVNLNEVNLSNIYRHWFASHQKSKYPSTSIACQK